MESNMQKQKLTSDDIGILLFVAALIIGAWFRLYPPGIAGFPINDGGLFYKMIEAIQVNNYRLPGFVQYNGLNIPFAYPPLAFYLANLVTDIFHTTIFNTLLWLPAIILIAGIPAIYYLASVVLKSRFQAGLATFLYALLPRSITWLIMGGGITRSFGQLFLILATANIYLLFTTKQKKYLIHSILFSSLLCLTHPEATLHAIVIAVLLLLFYGKNKEGIINSLFVAFGTLILTSPWWITMVLRFGLNPYFSAAQTGLHGFNNLIVLFVPFSEEPFLTIIALLAVIGIAVKIAKGEYLLPIWYVLPFLIEPRNAPNVSIIPMAFLASIALTDLIFPTLSKFESNLRNMEFNITLQSRAEKFLFSYLSVCLFIGMLYFGLDISENRVSPKTKDAFEWIKLNTPENGKFINITGQTNVFADFTNEWFPVFTNRTSLTTIQGYEWMDGVLFNEYVAQMQKLQLCMASSYALDCVESTAGKSGMKYDYIYVTRINGDRTWGNNLIYELRNSKSYAPVYEQENIMIFRYNR